jgi:hypothetical protein
LSVSSQVKKLKTDSQYAWKYEGNKVQYLLNSEFIEELALAVWAIDILLSSSESLATGLLSY